VEIVDYLSDPFLQLRVPRVSPIGLDQRGLKRRLRRNETEHLLRLWLTEMAVTPISDGKPMQH
jgi:hypothetical protein